MRIPLLAATCLALLFTQTTSPAQALRLYASPALGQAVASLLPALREAGFEVLIKGEAASSMGIQLLASGEADAVFSIRPLSGEDRALAPEKQFVEYRIATQAVAVLVSRDVWEGGVRSASKEQLRQIYEREITNWQPLGGPAREIKFYNVQQGQGVWEQFVGWVYGEIRRAPLGKFETVVSGEDARNALEFNGGSISLGAPRWSDGREVFALALRAGDEAPVAPTSQTFSDRSYPLARPMMILLPDKPTGVRADLIQFLLGETAQEILFKAGLVPVREKAAR